MESNRLRSLGAIIVGFGLIALGVFFLLGQILHLDIWSNLWPFFIIVPGLFFFAGMIAMGKNGAPLAVPGSIVTVVGMLLLYQSITGRWASWAYAWALIFPTATGLGLAIAGMWRDDPKAVKLGTSMATIGLIVFALLGVFFELLLDISGLRSGVVGRLLLPLVIIGTGLVILVLALIPRKTESPGR